MGTYTVVIILNPKKEFRRIIVKRLIGSFGIHLNYREYKLRKFNSQTAHLPVTEPRACRPKGTHLEESFGEVLFLNL